SKPADRCGLTGCSIRSARTSRWPRRSGRASTPSGSSSRARPASRRLSSPGPPEPMSATAPASLPARAGLAPALSAARARLGLVALLFAVAAVGWWWTGDQMRGMDHGPWTGLRSFGRLLGVWVVMMAAMMFPSVAPTGALYSRMTKQRAPLSPLLFASGYLVTWALAGVGAFAIGVTVHAISADVFVWNRAGRWTAGGILV